MTLCHRFPNRLALAAALLAAIPACHSQPPSPEPPELPASVPATQPSIPARIDPVLLNRADIYALANFSGVYQFTRGSMPARQVSCKVESLGDKSWRLSLEGVRTIYLQETPDGAIVISRQEELSDNVALTYTPPLQMLPPQLAPNHPQEFDCQVVIRSLKTGLMRDKGDCHGSIELLGQQQVQTAAGDFNAYMVRSVRHLSLNLASVKISQLDAFVPDKGAVVERVEQVRSILGLISTGEVEESRLVQ